MIKNFSFGVRESGSESMIDLLFAWHQILGKLFNLPVSQFPYLEQMGIILLTNKAAARNTLIQIKHLSPYLVGNDQLINSNHY